MKNDQIKSQIENAKKAFIAGKERNREVISSELDTADTKVQKDLVPEDRQLQADIMSRVRGLMDEATQTSKGGHKINSSKDRIIHAIRRHLARPTDNTRQSITGLIR